MLDAYSRAVVSAAQRVSPAVVRIDVHRLLTENHVGREAEIVMLRRGELLRRGIILLELGSR